MYIYMYILFLNTVFFNLKQLVKINADLKQYCD